MFKDVDYITILKLFLNNKALGIKVMKSILIVF